MICNCVEELTAKLHDEVHKRFSRPNKPVQHFNIQTTMGGFAIVRIDIDLKGQMKPVQSFVVADFCPWCGKKYERKD